jgi:hypothetical protein
MHQVLAVLPLLEVLVYLAQRLLEEVLDQSSV